MARGQQRASEDIEWLLSTTNRMVGCRSVAALLDLAYDAIREGLGYDRVSFLLVNSAQGTLVEHIGTDAAGRKVSPSERVMPLDGGGSYPLLLTDPRLQADGPGFVFMEDAVHEAPPEAQRGGDGRPSQSLRVALRSATTVLGFISVENLGSRRPLTPQDAPPLVAFANALAAAVESVAALEARGRRITTLDEDLRQRVEQLSWLQEASARLGRLHDLEDVLDNICTLVCAGLGYDRLGLFLLTPGPTGEWLETEVRGVTEQGDLWRARDRGATPLAFRADDPALAVNAPDVFHLLRGHAYYYCPDSWAITAVEGRALLSGEVHEQLVVALRQDDTLLGYLSVDNLLTARPITEVAAPPLVAFAAQAALTISRARLWTEHTAQGSSLARRVRELEWLGAMSGQVNAAHTLEEVLDVAYAGIRTGLGYDRVGIQVVDQAAGIWEERLGTDAEGRKFQPVDRVFMLTPHSAVWRLPDIAALLAGAESYYTADAVADTPPEQRYLLDGGPREQLTVAIRAGHALLGSISVDNLVTGRPITATDAGPLLALAHQVGTALENARLQEWQDAEGARLAASEESLRTMMATMACGVVVVTPSGEIADANEAAQQILGQSLDELRGRLMSDALQATDWEDGKALPLSERPVSVALRTRQPQHAVVMEAILPNGARCALQVDAVPLLDAQGTLLRLIVSFIDITLRKRAEETLTHQALHDSLTGLPNRVLLADRLAQALLVAHRTATALTLLLLDLDHFKEVNDSLGHAVGDVLLQDVAARLRSALRGADTVARLGGDEFAVLLPSVDIAGATHVAETLLAALEAPFLVEEHRFTVEASIGIATSALHGSDAATLRHHADVAMYAAKRDHLGYAVYTADMDPQTASRLALLSDLRTSLAGDHLLLYYQPKLHIATARPWGVEALLRWPHPRHGFISPDQLIPLAEQTALMGPLTQWVLETGLRQCRAWTSQGQPLNVAINLSTRTLHDQQLPQTIAGLLHTYALAPTQLTLEITESALMVDPARSLEVLTRLAGLGVRLALDDFGTGYSSLGYLKRLPVHEVKIDKSFVLAMSSDPKDAAIVHAVIVLAHALDLEVVAEGVEDQATWDLLAGWGCDSAQGYYMSRPLPAGEFPSWLSASAWR